MILPLRVFGRPGTIWIRSGVAYHKFPNVREKFQGDLNKKVMNGIVSKDFKDRGCNCNAPSKVNGKCVYGGCTTCCVVYQVTCKCCDMIYIGCTQNNVKKRINQHLGEVRKSVETGAKFDTFSDHFATHFIGRDKITVGQIRPIISVEILWQGNPIGCMKTFSKRTCVLCMRERSFIYDNYKKNKKKLINSRSEIYGGCRHKTKFHRFERNIYPAHDDGRFSPERVNIHNTTTSVTGMLSQASSCLCSVINTVVTI